MVMFFTSACSANLFASPTPTFTLTSTQTNTPEPTNTSTPTKTPRPTNTPIPPTPTPELPKGTPLAEWSKIPVMPNAMAGETGETFYMYITKTSVDDVLAYYVQTMPKYGWKFVDTIPLEDVKEVAVTEDKDGYTLSLGFSIGFIFIYREGDITHVDILINPR
jgi:hypothetical protein